MPVRRRALLAALTALLVLTGAGQANAAPPRQRTTATGTYRLLAKDVVVGGSLRHVYEDVLDANGRLYRLRLPKRHRLTSGQRVTIAADTVSTGGTQELAVTSYQPMAMTASAATTGPTRVLVILAYWTAPDVVTQQKATDQILGDDARWYREASYGATTLTGAVTPWVRIPAPTDGACYVHADEIMANAKAKARGLGTTYDSTTFDRTIVYFPRCTGSDTTNVAGWALQPGSSVWLNGYMDRRTSVHEQGHNLGMGHGHSYACTASGTRVTLGGTCTKSDYGDPYDAMGQSGYAAHFSAYNKDVAGWLGTRKRILTTSSASFTLAPYETVSSGPVAAVVNSPVAGREYWLEYRRPVGYDATLPAGATGGVLVHLRDPAVGAGAFLLDGTPTDATMSTAVIRSGTSWTAPDGVRIAVGTVTSTGAPVSVSGARPEPQPPTAPRALTGTALDSAVSLSWSAPLSDGGQPVLGYQVTARASDQYAQTLFVSAPSHQMVFPELANGTAYTFSVLARNRVGDSASVTTTATPHLMLPSAAVVSPSYGSVLSGRVTVQVAATPNPESRSPITWTEVRVDSRTIGTWYGPPVPFEWFTGSVGNGSHELSVQTHDQQNRFAYASTTVTTDNAFPEVTITSPANGTSADVASIALEAQVLIPARSSATLTRVEYAVNNGPPVTGAATAPYGATLDTRQWEGTYRIVAYAYDSSGLRGTSPPISVTVRHPPPTVQITSPASGGVNVTGTTVPFTADVAVTAAGSAVAEVRFVADYRVVGVDTTAPYGVDWDISSVSGWRYLTAEVVETSGRTKRSSASVYVGNSLPLVSIGTPGYYQSLVAKPQVLAGTATAYSQGASVARVVVTVDGVDVPATVDAATKTWRAPWDASGTFGQHELVATVWDTTGLHWSTSVPFSTRRPDPVTSSPSPAAGTAVPTAQPVDLAIAVAPGEYDPGSVAGVCFHEWYGYDGYLGARLGCGTLGADGRWHFAWTPTWATDYILGVQVRMDDGTYLSARGPAFTVADPPWPVQDLTANTEFDGAVELSWQPWSQAVPATSWIVSVVDGASSTVTSPSARVTGLVNGRRYQIRVYGVSAMGVGDAASVFVQPGLSTSLQVTSPLARTTLTYGTRMTVTARLTAALSGEPAAGQVVDLMLCPDVGDSCEVGTRAVTSSTGVATLTFAPRTTGTLAVHFRSAGKYLETWEYPSSVVVLTKVTGTLSSGRVPYGATVYMRGTVSPAKANGTVYLQRYYLGVWRIVTWRPMSSTGYVSIPIKNTRGTYVYRLMYKGDGGRMPGGSPARTVTFY